MTSFVSENVAGEKVDAMRKFERRRTFLKFLPAFEALVVVLLLLSWLTPTLSAGEYLRRILSGGFTGGISMFCVVNVLIALIYSLSNHHKKLLEPDMYFQYVSSSSTSPVNGCSSEAASDVCSSSDASPVNACSSATASGVFSSSAAVSESSASSENQEKTPEGESRTDLTTVTARETRPVRREMVRAVSSVTETAHAIRKRHEMTFLPPATNDHQVYRRSRSERLDTRPGGDFRRSMRRLCEIDDLSSDEFRSTVETFIAGKKKMLSKQWKKP